MGFSCARGRLVPLRVLRQVKRVVVHRMNGNFLALLKHCPLLVGLFRESWVWRLRDTGSEVSIAERFVKLVGFVPQRARIRRDQWVLQGKLVKL